MCVWGVGGEDRAAEIDSDLGSGRESGSEERCAMEEDFAQAAEARGLPPSHYIIILCAFSLDTRINKRNDM